MTIYIVKTKTSEYMVDVEGRFWMRNLQRSSQRR